MKATKDQLIINRLADDMTIRLRPTDLANLRFYYFSKTRICVNYFDTLLPEVWAKNNGPTLKAMGLTTVQELGQWLLSHGVKEIKKPKPYRAPMPIYD